MKNLRYTTLAINGMTSAPVARWRQKMRLKRRIGVINAKVGFKENLEGVCKVMYNPNMIDLAEIVKAVEPYKANVVSDEIATSINLEDLPK